MTQYQGVSLASIVEEIDKKQQALKQQMADTSGDVSRQQQEELEAAIETLGGLRQVVKGLCPMGMAFPPKPVTDAEKLQDAVV